MKQNFAAALRRVLVHEGGWGNHPNDPGGPTMKGVTQRVYNAYRDNYREPRQSVRHIGELELQTIYKRQYADAIRFDELPDGVDYCVFDGAVNSGPSQAAKWLQRALGASQVDGHVGAITIDMAKAADPVTLVNKICDERMAFLRRLRTWSVFGPGWTRRVSEVRKAAVAMATGAKAPKQTKMDAEETGKAPPTDIKVSETEEGKSDTAQTTQAASGGIFVTLMGYFDQASQYFSLLSGLPESVTKAIVGGVIIAAGVAFVYFVGRAIYRLWSMWREKRAGEGERALEAGNSAWREKVIPEEPLPEPEYARPPVRARRAAKRKKAA